MNAVHPCPICSQDYPRREEYKGIYVGRGCFASTCLACEGEAVKRSTQAIELEELGDVDLSQEFFASLNEMEHEPFEYWRFGHWWAESAGSRVD